MVGETVTLQNDYTTRFGTVWPAGSEIEVEQRVRHGWQCGYKTPDGRIGTQSLLRDEIPPEVRQMLTAALGSV